MTPGIANKVVLITGGSTGIGAEVARTLAAKGAKVAIAARRVDKLDAVSAEIVAQGGIATAYEMDVTDRLQVKSVVDQVAQNHGRLDVIINNAGIMPIRPMAEVNVDEWDAMIDVNLKGTLYGIAATLPALSCPGKRPCHQPELGRRHQGLRSRRDGLLRHQVRSQRHL